MPAGYSRTPLVRKLGIRAGMTCTFIDAPGDYRDLLVGLPDDLAITDVSADGVGSHGQGFARSADDDPTITDASAEGLDFVHLFVERRAGLAGRLRKLRQTIARNGMIWVSWPKRTSGVDTDLTGDVVRAAGLSAGLVDVKVCAVDDTWSGLKFVIRKADR